MSRIIDIGGTNLPFGIYVPAAVVENGSLIVKWATGQKATTQIDWGLDASVPNTTTPALLQPGDPGYVQGQPNPVLERYHNVPFPHTYVDATHYFRVRSTNSNGKTLESDVYSVYLTNKFELEDLLVIQPPRTKEATLAPAKRLPAVAAAGTGISFNASKTSASLAARFKGTKPAPQPPVFRAAATTTQTIEISTTVEPIA